MEDYKTCKMDSVEYPVITFYPEPNFRGEPFDAKTKMGDLNDRKSYKVVRGTWLLYSDSSFKGHKVTAKEGDMCRSTNIKSAQEEGSVNPGIILYPELDYRGIPFFVNSKLGDLPVIRSLHVHRGTWMLYATKDFTGPEVTVKEEDSKNSTSIMSVAEAKEPSGAVCIYPECNFKGKVSFLDKSEETLTGMRSYKVYKGLWRFYPKPKFAGEGVDGYPGCSSSDAHFQSVQRF